MCAEPLLTSLVDLAVRLSQNVVARVWLDGDDVPEVLGFETLFQVLFVDSQCVGDETFVLNL